MERSINKQQQQKNDDKSHRRKRYAVGFHPLQMPLRRTTDGVCICRYHNYDRRFGCKKYNQRKTDPDNNSYGCCELDHDHCHICLKADGHIALDCPIFHCEKDFAAFLKECQEEKMAVEARRPSPVEGKTRTVLGDDIFWVDHLGCPVVMDENKEQLASRWKQGDDQLLRCRRHKQWEAKLLLTLPHGASYLDVGAHFGDSVVSMAAYARSHGRADLRFFAWEPNAVKCQWIRKALEANQLNNVVTVIQAAVGSRKNQWMKPQTFADDDTTAAKVLVKRERSLLNGSLGYMPCADCGENENNDTVVPMVTLDEFVSTISPLGLLHLDVEGGEEEALRGAFNVLLNASTPCYLVVEAWDDKQCQKRGIDQNTAGRIHQALVEFNNLCASRSNPNPKFLRGKDMMDCERNLFYSKV